MPIATSTQTHAWNIDNAAIFITQLGKKFGIIKLSMWMIYVLGPIHDNFISWWQGCMLIIWQSDKVLRDLRNNKGRRRLSLISMKILVGGTDQKCFWILCLHTVHMGTWIRYKIQQCHCFIPAETISTYRLVTPLLNAAFRQSVHSQILLSITCGVVASY